MQHKIITVDSEKFLFSIGSPFNPRFNLSKEFGQLVSGDVGNLSPLEADKAGMLYGNFLELAICYFDCRVMTFQPHYENEPFLTIYGFPVGGDYHIKELTPKSSHLISFALRTRSTDIFLRQIIKIEQDLVNSYALEIDNFSQEINDYVTENLAKEFTNNIFTLQTVRTSGKNGDYYYLNSKLHKPESNLQKAALKMASEINQINHQSSGKICRNQIFDISTTQQLTGFTSHGVLLGNDYSSLNLLSPTQEDVEVQALASETVAETKKAKNK